MWWVDQLPSFGISLIACVAFWLVGSGKRIGWFIGAASEWTWVAYALWIHQYGLLLSSFVFFAVYVRGWMKWKHPPHR